MDKIQIHFDKVIETDTRVNFCGGCNNSVILKRFIALDEGQMIEDAIEERMKNKGDRLFDRTRHLGFCLCGKIYIYHG